MGVNALLAGYLAMKGQQQSEAEWRRQQAIDAATEAFRQASLRHGLEELQLKQQQTKYEQDPNSPDNLLRIAQAEDVPARRKAEEERAKREDTRLQQAGEKMDWTQFMDAYLRSGMGLGAAWSLSGQKGPVPQEVLDQVTQDAIRQGLIEQNVPIPEGLRQGVDTGLSAIGAVLGGGQQQPAPGGMGPAATVAPSAVQGVLPAGLGVPKSQGQMRQEALSLPAPEFARKQAADRVRAELEAARVADLQAKQQIAKQRADAYVLSVVNTDANRKAMLGFQQSKEKALQTWRESEHLIRQYVANTGRMNAVTAQGRLADSQARTGILRDTQNLRQKLGPYWGTIATTKRHLDDQENRLVGTISQAESTKRQILATPNAKDDPRYQEALMAAEATLYSAGTAITALRNSQAYKDINGDPAAIDPEGQVGLYPRYKQIFQAREEPGKRVTGPSGKPARGSAIAPPTASSSAITNFMRRHGIPGR